jgi:IstB-like ATP binding protein
LFLLAWTTHRAPALDIAGLATDRRCGDRLAIIEHRNVQQMRRNLRRFASRSADDGTGGELRFEVFSRRYGRGATMVTSNLPFDEWTTIFGSERLTGALLDRLTHHVHILEMNGESYRLAASKKAQRRAPHRQSQNPKSPNEGDPATKI